MKRYLLILLLFTAYVYCFIHDTYAETLPADKGVRELPVAVKDISVCIPDGARFNICGKKYIIAAAEGKKVTKRKISKTDSLAKQLHKRSCGSKALTGETAKKANKANPPAKQLQQYKDRRPQSVCRIFFRHFPLSKSFYSSSLKDRETFLKHKYQKRMSCAPQCLSRQLRRPDLRPKILYKRPARRTHTGCCHLPLFRRPPPDSDLFV
jgi:hypothetical protein